MLHEQRPEHLPEQMSNYDRASDAVASAALALTQVENEWRDCNGDITDELRRRRNLAGARYNLAIRGILQANQEIRRAEHGY